MEKKVTKSKTVKKATVASKPAAKKATVKSTKKASDVKTTIAKKPTAVKTTKPVAKKDEVIKEPAKKENNNKSALELAKELYQRQDYQKVLDRLKGLRKEGEWKVLRIKDENINIKINKQLNKEGREKLLELNKGELAVAKGVALQNKPMINKIVKETVAKSKVEFKPIFAQAKKEKKESIIAIKKKYREDMIKAKEDFALDKQNLETKYENSDDKKSYKVDKKAIIISYKSKVNAAKSDRDSAIQKAKDDRFETYQTSYDYMSELRLNKHTQGENIKFGKESYVRNFNFISWLTKNALLLIVLLTFITMILISVIAKDGKIVTPEFFLDSMSQIAPKIFFALGVAGLILLGGTDLSIGRLTAAGASFTCMILTTAPNEYSWFKFLADTNPAVRVIFAIVFSILVCTLFTTISGFFTAKFKMHPFVSTLAVQLIVYGFFQTFFGAVSSFNIADEKGGGNIRDMLAGKGGWLLIVYAIAAIVVVWFIWNKTKFGKHLYAVGGNQEAAAVSGINPFAITMLAFVMAGVLYGLGGFVQALQAPSANFNSYVGTETDAIAACVIGGISFSGGVGNVLGAVGGAIILGFLTTCFTNLQIDVNIQFVIKGLIILIAVTLDCVKYIRKK